MKMDSHRIYQAFKMLELAKKDMFFTARTPEELIPIAIDYGKSINLTKEECRYVLNLKLKDILS